MVNLARIRCRVFGISPDETKFTRRGFPAAESVVQRHLEAAGGAFVAGYNMALQTPQAAALLSALDAIEAMHRGFAYEGAAMGLALLDLVTPWNRDQFQRFADTPQGDAHLYMIHIGAGWAIARIPWARRKFERALARFHPLYRWLALDGYGFHQGFFYLNRYVMRQIPPRGLSPRAARVFDQGLGRSLWFSQGANPERIAATISAFPASRHSDLWSGAGLAASYAGGADRMPLEVLLRRAGDHAPRLAQGAAFAAKARQRAGNPMPHTAMACDLFCHMTADQAAAVTDEQLPTIENYGEEKAYEEWRARISASFSLAKRPGHRTMAEVPS